MNKRFLTIAILLNILLFTTTCVLLYRLRSCEESLRQMRIAASYESLGNRLRIPAEALYLNLNTDSFEQICRLRQQSFPDEFHPYRAVLQARSDLPSKWPSGMPGNIWNGSFEIYWLNEAHHGLIQLASYLERECELGSYIRVQQGKKEATLVPLVIRLLDSRHRWHRIEAARVLLLMGNGDQKIKDVLTEFLRESQKPVVTDGRQEMRYSRERDQALQLDTKYKLGLLDQIANKTNER